jgi:hypothetical protein
MRPSSIVAFEQSVLISLALGFFNSWLSWDRLMSRMPPEMSPMTIVLIMATVALVYLLLLWFISRRGSSVAKWIYVVLVGSGIPLAFIRPPETLSYGLIPATITIVQYLLAAVSFWFLFRSDARRWFRKEWSPVDPEIFR